VAVIAFPHLPEVGTIVEYLDFLATFQMGHVFFIEIRKVNEDFLVRALALCTVHNVHFVNGSKV